jgi:hypothetical protein
MEQSVRERQVDIKRLAADLTIDMKRKSVDGSVTVVFTPLQAALDTLFFDAAGLEVDHVEFLGVESAEKLDYSIEDRKLRIAMPVGIAPGDDVAIGLGSAGGDASAKALEKAITSDSAEEVIGAAAIALEKMGELHHADDLDFLREYAATDLDPNLQKAARDAAETIAGFVNVKALQSR